MELEDAFTRSQKPVENANEFATGPTMRTYAFFQDAAAVEPLTSI
jgi:hypothetical protein